MKNTVLWIIRLLVGGLFIFSGIVKANDPLGLSYKTQEFFEKMNLSGLHDYTLTLSIIMITLEIMAGVAVIIGHRFRLYGPLLLGLILFFTYLTGFALFVKGPDGLPIIKECGCFGDCIKLTNWETFNKDMALLVLILILLIFRKSIKPIFSLRTGTAIMIATLVLSIGAQLYVLRHLPFVDCLPYAIGKNIPSEMTVPAGDEAIIENTFVYEKNGEKKNFTIDNLPDSTWNFVDRIDVVVQEAKSEPTVHDFVINDANGNDITQSILESAEPVHLWLIKDMQSDKGTGVAYAKNKYEQAVKSNEYFYLVCSSSPEDISKFKTQYQLPDDMPICTLDGTTMKTMMRNNEGMMTLVKGTVTEKYSVNDFSKH